MSRLYEACGKTPVLEVDWIPTVCGECGKSLCRECRSETIHEKYDADCCKACAKEVYNVED